MFKNINLGIKISLENFDLLPTIYERQNLIDFIEIRLPFSFKEKDLNSIQKIKIPYAIHFPTSRVGLDLGEIKNQKRNSELIDKINRYEDIFSELKPISYIIHPESGNFELSISNLKKFRIKPIAIENMPLKGIYGYDLIGFDPDSLKEFFKRIPTLEFCFDINHAIKASLSLKKNYLNFINQFLKLKKPIIVHISGGNINIETDEHLALNEGQFNLYEIKKILLNYCDIINLTFETPTDYEKGIENDLKNIRIFINTSS